MKRLGIIVMCVLIVAVGVFSAIVIRHYNDASAEDHSGGSADSATPAAVSLAAGEVEILPLTNGLEKRELAGWTSSDESIVTVDSGGRLDALREGSADVTATFADGHVHTCRVNVTKPETAEKTDTFSTAITANEEILQKNLTNPAPDKKQPYRLHVNRKKNCVTAYTYGADGKYTVPVRAMICSCGLNGSTITGVYNIYFHTVWHPLVNNVMAQYASAIAGDYMFHSVPYTDYANDTLKVEEYNKLGVDASSGCIRMAVADVKWINDNCDEGTIVFLYDGDESGPLGKPESMHLNDTTIRWDPTDRAEGNPYSTRHPEIKGAKNVTVKAGSGYSATDGVTAVDTCGNDITKKITVTGNVDPNRPGTYKVTYAVTDLLHRSTKTDITVTVEPAEKEE